MSYLSIMESRLPPGFRFHPRDEELICDYLAKKIAGDDSGSLFGCPTMVDVDLNKVEPWDLPEMACVGGNEWYFYSLRDRKYATGHRTNRATVSGYWKATGKDRHVTRDQQGRLLVGMRKTLVFYQGRAPKGTKTDWVMHEFRMQPSNFSVKDQDWVLCRVFYKSRGLSSSKPSYDEDTTSSSLQPLTETYITFAQTPAASLEGYEQVPCFSNPFQNSSMATAIQRNMMPFKNPAAAYAWGLPDLASGLNHQLDCDNKVMSTVLNHLITNTKLEGNQKTQRDTHPTIGEEGSIDSYLYLSSEN